MLRYGTTSLLDGFPTFQDSVISSSGIKNSMKIVISTTGISPNVGHFSPTAHPKRTETTPHGCERLKSTAVRVLQTILTRNSEKSYPTHEETAEHFFVVTTIDGETNK
jgi:hypothetical protein